MQNDKKNVLNIKNGSPRNKKKFAKKHPKPEEKLKVYAF